MARSSSRRNSAWAHAIHLSRQFRAQLGATPGAVARTRRVQLAKKLLDETDLAITEIAFMSGFASIRRFNAVFAATYGQSPSMIRRTPPKGSAEGEAFTLRLAYRPPLNWPCLAAFLRAEATPGVEEVSEQGYCRTITAGDADGWLSVRPLQGRNEIAVSLWLPRSRQIRRVIERVTVLCDLRADPLQIAQQLVLDDTLADVPRYRPGLRLPGAWDGFELAVRAVVAEEVGGQRATSVMGELARAHGRQIARRPLPGPSVVFPAPVALASADLSDLGLSRRAKQRLRNLSQSAEEGMVNFGGQMEFDELVHWLSSATGLTNEHAQWVAMRSLGEPDAAAFGAAGTPCELVKLSATDLERWRPWRSYVAISLATDYVSDASA